MAALPHLGRERRYRGRERALVRRTQQEVAQAISKRASAASSQGFCNTGSEPDGSSHRAQPVSQAKGIPRSRRSRASPSAAPSTRR